LEQHSSNNQGGTGLTEAQGWFGIKKPPKWVGGTVIAIGLLSMVGGIGGGILEMFVELQNELNGPGLGMPELPTGFIEALIEFMQALASAPQWLALAILGIFLVSWGASML
jgi:hypothetical protein